MKKFYSILLCLLVFKSVAQTEPAGLFDMADESLFGESTEQVFTGKPIVLIEKQVQPQKQINKAELLPPPDLRNNTLNIPIKTFFGHDRTAAFIDHTTDFFVMMQVLDDKTVRVTEQIQFITTKEGEKFTRFFPSTLNPGETKALIKPEILSLKRDNAFVPFEISESQNGMTVSYAKSLPKGVHKMTLEYLLPNLFKVNRSLAETFLPITGPSWGQMIERMAVMVMMPQKSHFYKKEILFGSNNQKIPENVKISEDGKGVLIFQNTHPLPAYADLRIHLIMDAKDLPNAPKKENFNLQIIGIFSLVLLGYVVLSILSARLKKWKRPLAESKKINPLLWANEIGITFNDYQTSLILKSDPPIQFSKMNSAWIKVLAFLRFNSEYIVGVVFLILGVKYVAGYFENEISQGIYNVFFILSVVAVLAIDYYGTRVQMRHLGEALKKALISEPQGLNLAKREVPVYYQMAICLGFQDIWKNRLLANNPSYKDLTCFEKEK